jgi:hypothetical protein
MYEGSVFDKVFHRPKAHAGSIPPSHAGPPRAKGCSQP